MGCLFRPCNSGPDDLSDEPNTTPLTINGAGSVCVGYSPRGTRLAQAHPAHRPFSIWKAERAAVMDDIYFHENAYTFPTEHLQPPEGQGPSSHGIVSILWGPESAGWPVNRKRRLSCGYNQERLQWVGPLAARMGAYRVSPVRVRGIYLLRLRVCVLRFGRGRQGRPVRRPGELCAHLQEDGHDDGGHILLR